MVLGCVDLASSDHRVRLHAEGMQGVGQVGVLVISLDARQLRSARRGRVRRLLSQGSKGAYSEKGEVLLRGVGTLRYVLILSENSACQVPICAVAA